MHAPVHTCSSSPCCAQAHAQLRPFRLLESGKHPGLRAGLEELGLHAQEQLPAGVVPFLAQDAEA